MVGIVTTVRAGRSDVKIAAQTRRAREERDFYLLQIVQTVSETNHSPIYWVPWSFPEGKAARA
jgi:hypothetical protein